VERRDSLPQSAVARPRASHQQDLPGSYKGRVGSTSLAQSTLVASRPQTSGVMASPAAATSLRRASASGPYRPLCSALDAPHRPRFRREQRTEAWKTDLAQTLLGALPPSFPGAATAATLLAGGRRESTWGSYSGKLQRFIDFCQLIVPQFGLPPVRALPARPDYIAAYIGYLRDEGLVHANSLQPYLSCINQWHADMGLEKPAVGHLIQRLRRGFGEAEGNDAEGELVASRRPIPAPIMLQVLHLARNSRRDHSQRGRLLRRAATASVLAFSLCCAETVWSSYAVRMLP